MESDLLIQLDNSTKKSKQKTGKIFLEAFLHNVQNAKPHGKAVGRNAMGGEQTKMSPKNSALCSSARHSTGSVGKVYCCCTFIIKQCINALTQNSSNTYKR